MARLDLHGLEILLKKGPVLYVFICELGMGINYVLFPIPPFQAFFLFLLFLFLFYFLFAPEPYRFKYFFSSRDPTHKVFENFAWSSQLLPILWLNFSSQGTNFSEILSQKLFCMTLLLTTKWHIPTNIIWDPAQLASYWDSALLPPGPVTLWPALCWNIKFV